MNSKGEFQPKVTKVAAELVKVRAEPGTDTGIIRVVVQRLHQAEREAILHAIDEVECIPEERDNYIPRREALRYLRALAKVMEQES